MWGNPRNFYWKHCILFKVEFYERFECACNVILQNRQIKHCCFRIWNFFFCQKHADTKRENFWTKRMLCCLKFVSLHCTDFVCAFQTFNDAWSLLHTSRSSFFWMMFTLALGPERKKNRALRNLTIFLPASSIWRHLPRFLLRRKSWQQE